MKIERLVSKMIQDIPRDDLMRHQGQKRIGTQLFTTLNSTVPFLKRWIPIHRHIV